MKLRVMGHNLYCRACVKPHLQDEDGKIILELTDHYRRGYIEHGTESMWLEVIGKGPEVGRKRDWTKAKLREFHCPQHLADCYEIGDLILCPARHSWGIKHVPYNDFEYFIDEAVPICAWREPAKGVA